MEVRATTGIRLDSTREFVITHGLCGTAPGDRFHRLAAALGQRFPDANVWLVDWSAASSAKICNLPNPWRVALSIDQVADQAAESLVAAGVDPTQTTLIGENFGNCVNARIAQQLGGVVRILAFNPAHEAGGYPTPDLRKCAARSWSFHTYSAFDTLQEIAEASIFLETPDSATAWEQHMAGIAWLANRMAVGDCSWLWAELALPPRTANHFHALATADGQLSDRQLPRDRPVRKAEAARSGGVEPAQPGLYTLAGSTSRGATTWSSPAGVTCR